MEDSPGVDSFFLVERNVCDRTGASVEAVFVFCFGLPGFVVGGDRGRGGVLARCSACFLPGCRLGGTGLGQNRSSIPVWTGGRWWRGAGIFLLLTFVLAAVWLTHPPSQYMLHTSLTENVAPVWTLACISNGDCFPGQQVPDIKCQLYQMSDVRCQMSQPSYPSAPAPALPAATRACLPRPSLSSQPPYSHP